jgi:hypothetical protein
MDINTLNKVYPNNEILDTEKPIDDKLMKLED